MTPPGNLTLRPSKADPTVRRWQLPPWPDIVAEVNAWLATRTPAQYQRAAQDAYLLQGLPPFYRARNLGDISAWATDYDDKIKAHVTALWRVKRGVAKDEIKAAREKAEQIRLGLLDQVKAEREYEAQGVELDGPLKDWRRVRGRNVWLYHGTTTAKLGSIMKEGLRPPGDAAGRSNVGASGHDVSRRASVFLTAASGDGSSDAGGYARRAASKHGGTPVVLRVLVPGNMLERDRDDADLSVGRWQFEIDEVTPDQIKEIDGVRVDLRKARLVIRLDALRKAQGDVPELIPIDDRELAADYGEDMEKARRRDLHREAEEAGQGSLFGRPDEPGPPPAPNLTLRPSQVDPTVRRWQAPDEPAPAPKPPPSVDPIGSEYLPTAHHRLVQDLAPAKRAYRAGLQAWRKQNPLEAVFLAPPKDLPIDADSSVMRVCGYDAGKPVKDAGNMEQLTRIGSYLAALTHRTRMEYGAAVYGPHWELCTPLTTCAALHVMDERGQLPEGAAIAPMMFCAIPAKAVAIGSTPAYARNAITIHSHPSGKPFSHEDLSVMVKHKAAGLVMLGQQEGAPDVMVTVSFEGDVREHADISVPMNGLPLWRAERERILTADPKTPINVAEAHAWRYAAEVLAAKAKVRGFHVDVRELPKHAAPLLPLGSLVQTLEKARRNRSREAEEAGQVGLFTPGPPPAPNLTLRPSTVDPTVRRWQADAEPPPAPGPAAPAAPATAGEYPDPRFEGSRLGEFVDYLLDRKPLREKDLTIAAQVVAKMLPVEASKTVSRWAFNPTRTDTTYWPAWADWLRARAKARGKFEPDGPRLAEPIGNERPPDPWVVSMVYAVSLVDRPDEPGQLGWGGAAWSSPLAWGMALAAGREALNAFTLDHVGRRVLGQQTWTQARDKEGKSWVASVMLSYGKYWLGHTRNARARALAHVNAAPTPLYRGFKVDKSVKFKVGQRVPLTGLTSFTDHAVAALKYGKTWNDDDRTVLFEIEPGHAREVVASSAHTVYDAFGDGVGPWPKDRPHVVEVVAPHDYAEVIGVETLTAKAAAERFPGHETLARGVRVVRVRLGYDRG